MRDLKDTCRVAVVQCAPVMFDKKASTEKMVELIREAGKNGAELIVFPELIIPCYPYGMTFGFTVGSRDKVGRLDWKRYYDNSLCIPGPETELLGQAAKEAHAYVSIGISERGEDSATLYNSNIVFSPEGELLNVHRKLKPTGAERLVYGDANKDYFPITETPWGPMGNLICWESYMPLARVALYQKGITIYISPNTNDNPEWQDTITLPLRATASSSTPTWCSPRKCIPRTSIARRRSRSSAIFPAAAAAAWWTPSAIT